MKKSISLFSPIFLLLSCNTYKAIPPEKYEAAVGTVLKTSTIGVPVVVDMKDVEVKLNKELVGLIYEDNSFENNNNDNIKVSAWKRDNFRLQMSGNELIYHIPLKLNVQVKKLVVLPAINAEIALDFKTGITLNKDWTLTTRTSSTGYQWISSPTMSIGGYEISIRGIADIILAASKGMIGTEVDKAIKDNLNIKGMISPFWRDLQQPVKIEDAYNTWLRIIPNDILCTQIVGNNNKLTFSAGIISVNEVFIGQKPDTLPTRKLPDLKILSTINNNMTLFVNTSISYDKITELSRKEMIGQVYEFGKKKVKVEDLTVYGSGKKVAVELNLSGDLKGNIYLMADPYYDKEKQTFYVRDVEFDVSTKNALIKSANWMLNGTLANIIENKMYYSMTEMLESSRQLIAESIRDYRSVKGMVIKGTVSKFDIDNIYPANESLKVVLVVEGKLALYVQGLSGM